MVPTTTLSLKETPALWCEFHTLICDLAAVGCSFHEKIHDYIIIAGTQPALSTYSRFFTTSPTMG